MEGRGRASWQKSYMTSDGGNGAEWPRKKDQGMLDCEEDRRENRGAWRQQRDESIQRTAIHLREIGRR